MNSTAHPPRGLQVPAGSKRMAGKRGLRLSSILVVVVVISVVAGLSVVNIFGVARPSLSRRSASEAHPALGPVSTATPPARAPGSTRVSAYLADLPRAETSPRIDWPETLRACRLVRRPPCQRRPTPRRRLRRTVPRCHHQRPGPGRVRRMDRQQPGMDGRQHDIRPVPVAVEDLRHHRLGHRPAPAPKPDGARSRPQDVVFCDQGGASCLSANWPAGECVQIEAQYGPSPASPTPPPALGSSHPEGTSCSDYSTPTFECFPYVVSLTPSGTTSLSVSGVQPDGALDATVTTGAVTTVSEVPPPPSTSTFTCQALPTSVTLSTTAGGLPATAPPPPTPPETDYRSPQTPPLPITGPLVGSTSTVASNDFSVPAFFPNTAGPTPCSAFLADSLNTYAGGWDALFKDQDVGLYYINGGTSPTVAEPGWAQFSATTTVVSVGLPTGPPSGFSF